MARDKTQDSSVSAMFGRRGFRKGPLPCDPSQMGSQTSSLTKTDVSRPPVGTPPLKVNR